MTTQRLAFDVTVGKPTDSQTEEVMEALVDFMPPRLRRITEESLASAEDGDEASGGAPIFEDRSSQAVGAARPIASFPAQAVVGGEEAWEGEELPFWVDKFYALMPVLEMLPLKDLCQFIVSMEDSPEETECLEFVLKGMRIWDTDRFYTVYRSTTPNENLIAANMMCTKDEGQMFALWCIYSKGAKHPILDNDRDLGKRDKERVFLADLCYLIENDPDEAVTLKCLESRLGREMDDLNVLVAHASKTVLHLAAERNRVHTMQALLDSGKVYVDQPCISLGKATTALHMAVSKDCLQAATILLEAGADVHGGSHAFSPAYYASSKRRSRCLPLLLKKGADTNACDRNRYATLVDRCMYWSRLTDSPPGALEEGKIRGSAKDSSICGRFSRFVTVTSRAVFGREVRGQNAYDFANKAEFLRYAAKAVQRMAREDAGYSELSDADRAVPFTLQTLVEHGALPYSAIIAEDLSSVPRSVGIVVL